MKKQKLLQIVRIVIQISMLFVLPGLFMMAFSELKEIVRLVFAGNFDLQKLLPTSLEFLALAVLTAILGRFFCGWLCAFGTYNDLVYMISKRLFKTSFRMDEKLDSWLKYIKYAVLACILLAGPGWGTTAFGSASPWEAFAQITALPDALFSLPIGFYILLMITVGAFFIERFFCRYLCPMGAFFSLLSRVSILGIRRASAGCGKCSVCTDSCTMGLRPDKAGMVKGGDCINCMKCTGACPGKNIRFDFSGRRTAAALACMAAIIVFLGIFNFSDSSGEVTAQSNAGSTENATEQLYKDGTYTGIGTGFRGGTTEIEVTVENGSITDIETVSHQDTPRFYDRVFDTIANEIIDSQSTDVDIVSGATYSCVGIMDAVEDALDSVSDGDLGTTVQNSADSSGADMTDKDVIGDSIDDSVAQDTISQDNAGDSGNDDTAQVNTDIGNDNVVPEVTTEPVPNTTSDSTENITQKYKDGTYTGTGTGFRGGTTEIEVTVGNGNITSIETISHQDTPRFYNRVFDTVANEIIDSQSTDVDIVSGATYSCRGIMAAVENALNSIK